VSRLLVLLLMVGCDLGAPLVARLDASSGSLDGGRDLVACPPIGCGTLPRLPPPVGPDREDCDADGLDDAVDPCPGVPAEEGDAACDDAKRACASFAAGVLTDNAPDLRGCRPSEPVVVARPAHVEDARLACATVSLRGAEVTFVRPRLDHAELYGRLALEEPSGRRAALLGEVRVEGGALESVRVEGRTLEVVDADLTHAWVRSATVLRGVSLRTARIGGASAELRAVYGRRVELVSSRTEVVGSTFFETAIGGRFEARDAAFEGSVVLDDAELHLDECALVGTAFCAPRRVELRGGTLLCAPCPEGVGATSCAEDVAGDLSCPALVEASCAEP